MAEKQLIPGRASAESKDVWGPIKWYWLHTEAIGYPESPTVHERVSMFARFWAFVNSLPCPTCRAHATEYARKYPPDMSGTSGLQLWAWRFHNAVNYRLGKSLMAFEKYQETYQMEISNRYQKFLD